MAQFFNGYVKSPECFFFCGMYKQLWNLSGSDLDEWFLKKRCLLLVERTSPESHIFQRENTRACSSDLGMGDLTRRRMKRMALNGIFTGLWLMGESFAATFNFRLRAAMVH